MGARLSLRFLPQVDVHAQSFFRPVAILPSKTISFPEPSLPLSSGAGNERLWDKAISDDKILVMSSTAQA